ncbi:MAG TPA: F0F1 ATP synthase subunit delta [Candidatus Chromulinivoraceae bacterium]|nr:F0F1 ATP synthase subunit delta [Candidatus Chromulinivoraceae bacterium]
MAGRLSRRKIALYAADKLHAGAKSSDVIKEVAAYLVDTRRTRELDLLVRDIEGELAARGTVIADVTTARPLTEALKKQIGTLVQAKSLHVRETIDSSILGGMRVDIPGKRFDGTLRRKLVALKEKQL